MPLVGVRVPRMPKRLLLTQAPRQAVALPIPLRLLMAVAGAVVVRGAAPDLLLPLRLLMAVVAGAAVVTRSHTPTMTPTTLHLVVAVAAVGAVAVKAVMVEGAVGATTQTSRKRRSCGNCSLPTKIALPSSPRWLSSGSGG